MDATQARSRATRARILNAGRTLFVQNGYERTTIRAVAAEAEADPALVMRYFGSKEGLFAAATSFDLRIPSFDAVPPDRIGEAVIRHFLTRWEGDPDDRSLQILLRAGVTNQEAAARIRTLFTEQVLPTAHAVALDQTEARAGLVASQLLGLAFCRYILAIPPMADLPVETVIACLAPTLQRYLTGVLDLNALHGALP